ncbi:MAG TPA: HAD family phosphatase [Candidatus Saccharimonadales bacterium]|nr:HAD family phosphatase [Candidatus Saccharimonadales bacterium]
MLKGVIFDLDGVVADSHPAHIKVWKELLASIDREVMNTDLQVVRDGRKKEDMLRYFFGDLTAGEIRDYGAEKDRLFTKEMPSITAVAGVRELLCELTRAAIPIGLASSGGSVRVHHLLDQLGLSSLFTAVVTGDEVAIGKPHPEIFRKAADQLGLPAHELLVFEDAVSGVQGAKAAHMKCFGVADHSRAAALRRAGAERVFPDFNGATLCGLQKFFSEGRPLPE